jgi:RimJ/RimL family protein N-acetyltransferase
MPLPRSLVETHGDLALLAVTRDSLDAEDAGHAALAALLGHVVPPNWPPEHNGPHTRAWMRALLDARPDEPGYAGWYVIKGDRLVGMCGFKGPPDSAGMVEIGYAVLPDFRRQGIARAAVELLVARAFRDARVRGVTAETLPTLVASRTVLDRCGFALTGRREDPDVGEVLRYRRERE